MHKKLEAELVSLAHTILQMKNRNDVVALKEKARVLYERLSVLTFVDEYLETTPNTMETKESLTAKIEEVIENKSKKTIEEPTPKVEVKENVKPKEIIEEVDVEEVVVEEVIEKVKVEKEIVEVEVEQEEVMIGLTETVVKESKRKVTIEEEFKDAVSVDVTTNLFTKVETKTATVKLSLNDKLQSNIQVGLNDRIAFVKHLFNHSQADFNRVLSQLNSFKTEKEAMTFINKMVKPDYDWSGKEEFEERFLELIDRKFL